VTGELASWPRRWWIALGVGLLLAVGYVLWAPHTADLAGQTARAELFRRSGYVPFWASWYSGIPTTSYSLVTPPLLGWLGPVWLGAGSVVAVALVAVPLLREARRPLAGAVAVVLAAGLNVLSGRTTFAVGVVVALLAVLAVERRRTVAAVGVATLATVTSPVAGFLLLVVAVALAAADAARRRAAIASGLGVIATLAVIAWLARGADGSGYEPLTRTSLLMAVGTALVAVVAPVSRRLRVIAAVTVVMLLGVYVVHSAIGANATRLAILATAPAVIAAAWGRLVIVTSCAVLAALLPIAQLRNDLAAAHGEDGTRAFVQPLLHTLHADASVGNHRVEVVDTATHWPSTYLSSGVALARGWERQIDEARNPMFYGRGALTPDTYRGFLDREAVAVVAVARGVPLDYGATREAALIDRGLPYLREVWRNRQWVLYDVRRPTDMVAAPARVSAITDTGLTVTTPAAGVYELRLRWSPYLTVDGGTVTRARDGNALLTLSAAGGHRVHAVWKL
jgi:hypothetical protein